MVGDITPAPVIIYYTSSEIGGKLRHYKMDPAPAAACYVMAHLSPSHRWVLASFRAGSSSGCNRVSSSGCNRVSSSGYNVLHNDVYYFTI